MKFLVLACFLVASVSAGRLRIADLRECGHVQNPIVKISGTVGPDPVLVPGDLTAVVQIEVTEDLPLDVIIEKDVRKLGESQGQGRVPCLDGVQGSCIIDLCLLTFEKPEAICPLLPEGVECKCPFAAGKWDKTAIINFGEQWLDLGFATDGDYSSRFNIISEAHPEAPLGCFIVDFTLSTA